MNSVEFLTMLGLAVTIIIFIISQWISNAQFKRRQELSYMKFQTETQLKLTQFNRELTELREKIQMNKEETILQTSSFRHETLLSLKDNKDDHSAINDRLTTVLSDLSFIKGKLSGPGVVKNLKTT